MKAHYGEPFIRISNTIIGREHISPWRRTRRSQDLFSRRKWDPSWRYRRLLDYITATNDGLRERARIYNATGCHCSAVWNLSPKCTSLHTRVSARVEQVRELLELRGSTRGITSAVRLHGIFVSDNQSPQEFEEATDSSDAASISIVAKLKFAH